MSEGGKGGYVGPPEIRDASIVGLFSDGTTLRVILKTQHGLGLTLTFRDVTAVVDKRPKEMLLAGLAKSRRADGQCFVFVNRDEGDDACLEVTAAGFEVSSAP